MEIYTLTKAGAEYAGTSIGTNMGIMAVTVGIEEIIIKLIGNKRL